VSDATNLVPGDTNFLHDVFVRDRLAGTTERVSVGTGNVQGNGPSGGAAISGDGRYVAFFSGATNLVPGDTNGVSDVFVRDRLNGTTERVSLGSSGEEGDLGSGAADISGNGRYVAFLSQARTLVPGDTALWWDVFVRDRLLGTTVLASRSSAGVLGNQHSWDARISADGQTVAFRSSATNLVAGDTNGKIDVFVRRPFVGTTERVSVDSSGVQANDETIYYGLSGNGRYVAFDCRATNLVAGDTNGVLDVFVRDLQASTTTRVSLDSGSSQGNGASYGDAISFDGRFVAFLSYASNFDPGGGLPNTAGIFIRDRLTGGLERVSLPDTAPVADGSCSGCAGPARSCPSSRGGSSS
jgi:Tol biopolymer transport system component